MPGSLDYVYTPCPPYLDISLGHIIKTHKDVHAGTNLTVGASLGGGGGGGVVGGVCGAGVGVSIVICRTGIPIINIRHTHDSRFYHGNHHT